MNPSGWTTEQQEEVYAALGVILQKPEGGCDYASQTDEELSASLNAVSQEIATRPTSTTQNQNSISFLGDTVIIPVEA